MLFRAFAPAAQIALPGGYEGLRPFVRISIRSHHPRSLVTTGPKIPRGSGQVTLSGGVVRQKIQYFTGETRRALHTTTVFIWEIQVYMFVVPEQERQAVCKKMDIKFLQRFMIVQESDLLSNRGGSQVCSATIWPVSSCHRLSPILHYRFTGFLL